MAESIRVPLWEDDNRLFAGIAFTIECRKPASIDDVIFGIGCTDRRCESQKLCRTQFACARHILKLLELPLLPHVGGKELRQPLFKIEIAGSLITEKPIAVAYDPSIQLGKVALGSSVVIFGRRGGKVTVYLRPLPRPLYAPVKRANHAVRRAEGQFVLPRLHAAAVPVLHQCHEGV